MRSEFPDTRRGCSALRRDSHRGAAALPPPDAAEDHGDQDRDADDDTISYFGRLVGAQAA